MLDTFRPRCDQIQSSALRTVPTQRLFRLPLVICGQPDFSQLFCSLGAESEILVCRLNRQPALDDSQTPSVGPWVDRLSLHPRNLSLDGLCLPVSTNTVAETRFVR